MSNAIGAKIDIVNETTGSLPAARLSGYPPVSSGALSVVANAAARLAQTGLAAGDSTIQTDTGVLYLLTALPESSAGNWTVWNPTIAGLTAANVVNVPAGGIAAVTVQAAIDELETEKGTRVAIQNQSYVTAADTGAADAYVIVCNPAVTGYVAGQRFSFQALAPNTGASTLVVNALAAKAIKKNVTDDLVAGDIPDNMIVEVVYDGTNFQLVSRPAVLGVPYVKVSDTQVAGTEGGASTSGSFLTHTVNTEDSDVAGICAIAANQITLSAGTYTCRIWSSYYKSNRAQTKLRNTTGATDLLIGTSEYSDSPNAVVVKSFICGKFTVAAAQALEIQYQVGSAFASQGLGVACNFGISEVYLVAEFEKVA